MARFLSPEWLARMATAAAESSALQDAATGPEVSVRHVVRGGPDGDVTYTVRLGGGTVTVLADGDLTDRDRADGDRADVVVTSDYATAAAISQGLLSPAAAFASGRLKLGGHVGTVAGLRGPNAETGLRGPNAEAGRAGVLAGLGDVFGSLRATTEY